MKKATLLSLSPQENPFYSFFLDNKYPIKQKLPPKREFFLYLTIANPLQRINIFSCYSGKFHDICHRHSL